MIEVGDGIKAILTKTELIRNMTGMNTNKEVEPVVGMEAKADITTNFQDGCDSMKIRTVEVPTLGIRKLAEVRVQNMNGKRSNAKGQRRKPMNGIVGIEKKTASGTRT